MEWEVRKKGVLEVLVRAIMSMHDGTKTRVRVGNDLSEEFLVTVGVHQGSVMSPLLFSIVIDVITKSARKNSMHEILYADDLVLLSDTMSGLREKFFR